MVQTQAGVTKGAVAERSRASVQNQLEWMVPGSNLGLGRIFSTFFSDGEQNIHHIVCVYSWLKTMAEW